MRTTKLIAIALLALAMGNLPSRAADPPKPDKLKETFERLLPGMSADEWATRGGPQMEWQEICFKLGAPGNEAGRAEACQLMAAKLTPATPAIARVWLLQQLERIGHGECVDALAAAMTRRRSAGARVGPPRAGGQSRAGGRRQTAGCFGRGDGREFQDRLDQRPGRPRRSRRALPLSSTSWRTATLPSPWPQPGPGQGRRTRYDEAI